ELDTEGARKQALRELATVPDLVFWLGIQNWLLGAGFVGVAMRFLGGADNALMLRIGLLGVLFGPITSMLVHLLVGLRNRETMRVVAHGLTPAAVVEALPPKRAQLRARLVIFTAIAVILPA